MTRWEKIQERIVCSVPVRASIGVMKKIHPPGFRGLSLWFVSKYLFEGIVNGRFAMRASAISFRMFLSFFPAIAILATLLQYIQIDGFEQEFWSSIDSFIPPEVAEYINQARDDVQAHSSGVISVSFIVGLFLASNTINSILIGFNGSIHIEKAGNIFILRLISIGILLVFGIVVASSVFALGFGDDVLGYLQDKAIIGNDWLLTLFTGLKWLLGIALIYFSVTLLYNFGNLNERKWKTLTAGASFTTLVFILSSAVFSWFIATFLNYDAIYGSIGSLLVLLFWINFNNSVLLLGFELNTSIFRAHGVATRVEEAEE